MERKRKSPWILIVIMATKFAKFAKLAKLAQAFKAIKALKLMVTFFSMAIGALLYSFLLGPLFAIGFVLLLFVHEMGHVLALCIKGHPVRAPIFIPFLGAAIFVPKFKDRQEEAFVGFGGPFLGTVASVLLFGLWAMMPSRPILLLALSYNFLFVNLFNLIPIRPFDGGRITQVAGKFFSVIGASIAIALPILLKNPGLLIIWILVLMDLNISIKKKCAAGLTCQAAMIFLMLKGYSDQGLVIDIIDNLMAVAINGLWLLLVIMSYAKG